MGFKFIHAADIHLDSPLRGLSRYEGVPTEDVRIATRTALGNLIDAAIEEQVAFVILAGDLYDGDWPDFGTGLFFCAAMGRLHKAGIDVYLLYGNHDAESVLTKRLPLPSNVHVFGTRKPLTFVHEATGVALHGWSYREKDTRDNLAASYPAPMPNRINIGVLHTALGGRPPHAPYAPCTPQELAAKGYDYWALGHVHDFEVVSTKPLIVFPGNIQGRSIREVGRKGAVLVLVDNDHVDSQLQLLALDAVRWARVEIDVSGIETEAELNGRVREAMQLAWSTKAEGRPLMVRVTLGGRTSLHGDLAVRRDAYGEAVRGIALAISERLWIEKVLIRTEPPDKSRSSDPTIRDELSGLLSRGTTDEELTASLKAELPEFFARTPQDLGADDEFLTIVRQGGVAALLQEAASAVGARLVEDAS